MRSRVETPRPPFVKTPAPRGRFHVRRIGDLTPAVDVKVTTGRQSPVTQPLLLTVMRDNPEYTKKT